MQSLFKSIERFGKDGFLSIARLGFKPPIVNEFQPDECREILVVRQDNRLGNLVLIEPLLRALKERLPKARITLVVGEVFSELYRPGSVVDEVIVFPHTKMARNPLRLLPWIRKLRRRRWDLAIDSAHPRSISTTNLLIASVSGARVRLGFAREGSERLLNRTIPAPEPHSYIEEQLLLLRPLGIEPPVSSPSFELPPGHEFLAAQFRQALKVSADEKLCGFWLGGRYDKRLAMKDFLNFYREFDEEKPRRFVPILFSGPNEEQLTEPGIRHYRFTGPIWELGACLKTLCWFLSMDSGPRHFAVALGVPSIGLFRGGAQMEYGHADGQKHFDFSIDHEPNLFSAVLTAVNKITENCK
ncbi:glycosyltransferase family 9 protein [bacterium]|nr:glycosyltransferase family 9 protein [bacterium]